MASSTDNVKLGVCTVLFDGANLGYTKGGVQVEVSTSTHEVKVDQFGETPINELITGRTVKASIPLAETTLENMVRIMPGATLVTDGAKATGSVTFASTQPSTGDTVTIGDQVYTFKTAATAVGIFDVAIGASMGDTATNFAAAINATGSPFLATVSSGVVTMSARETGTNSNIAFTSSGAQPTVSSATGGVNPKAARVDVTEGVNVSLLTIARPLILRPRGSDGSEDFLIHRAATAGAVNFTYNTSEERIFETEFKGYVREDGGLFSFGSRNAK